MNWVLIRRADLDPDRRDAHTQEVQVRMQPEGSPVQAEDRGLWTDHACPHLDLGLLASQTVRNTFLLCKPPGLWYFCMAALVS